MAKLVLSFNGDVVKDYELDKEILTIGRKPENDIHIDNLAVSGHHAKILTILNDSFIEDIGSTNGTFINGNKIVKHALQNGESIVIGQHELKYDNANADDEENDFEKTMIIRPDAEGMPETAESDKNIENSIGKIAADLASAGTTNNGPGPAKLQLSFWHECRQRIKTHQNINYPGPTRCSGCRNYAPTCRLLPNCG